MSSIGKLSIYMLFISNASMFGPYPTKPFLFMYLSKLLLNSTCLNYILLQLIPYTHHFPPPLKKNLKFVATPGPHASICIHIADNSYSTTVHELALKATQEKALHFLFFPEFLKFVDAIKLYT